MTAVMKLGMLLHIPEVEEVTRRGHQMQGERGPQWRSYAFVCRAFRGLVLSVRHHCACHCGTCWAASVSFSEICILTTSYHAITMLLILLSFCLLLLGHTSAQQCKLVAPSNAIARVSGSASTPTASHSAPTSSGVQVAGSSPSTTSASSASASPTLAPFDYGQEPIRGVNLCVPPV